MPNLDSIKPTGDAPPTASLPLNTSNESQNTPHLPLEILEKILSFIWNPNDILNFSIACCAERNPETKAPQLNLSYLKIAEETTRSYIRLFKTTFTLPSFQDRVIEEICSHPELIEMTRSNPDPKFLGNYSANYIKNFSGRFNSIANLELEKPQSASIHNLKEIASKFSVFMDLSISFAALESNATRFASPFFIFLRALRLQIQSSSFLNESLLLLNTPASLSTSTPLFFSDIPNNCPTNMMDCKSPDGSKPSHDPFANAARRLYLHWIDLNTYQQYKHQLQLKAAQEEKTSIFYEFFQDLLTHRGFYPAKHAFIDEYYQKRFQIEKDPQISRDTSFVIERFKKSAEALSLFVAEDWWTQGQATYKTAKPLIVSCASQQDLDKRKKAIKSTSFVILYNLLRLYPKYFNAPGLTPYQVPSRETIHNFSLFFSQKIKPLIEDFPKIEECFPDVNRNTASYALWDGIEQTHRLYPTSPFTNLYIALLALTQTPDPQIRHLSIKSFLMLELLWQKLSLQECFINLQTILNDFPEFACKETLIALVSYYLEEDPIMFLLMPKNPLVPPTPDYRAEYAPLYEVALTLLKTWDHYATLPLLASRFPQFADDFIANCEKLPISSLEKAIEALSHYPAPNNTLRENLEKLERALWLQEELPGNSL